jgi:hypothetical protein
LESVFRGNCRVIAYSSALLQTISAVDSWMFWKGAQEASLEYPSFTPTPDTPPHPHPLPK